MSLTISIHFLTGRAHLHPWQTHHSEGRVEWPPSHWRLLRAIVAVAGRGLTSLPTADYLADARDKPTPNKVETETNRQAVEYSALPDDWHGGSDTLALSSLAELVSQLANIPEIWLPRTSVGHTRQYFPTGTPDQKRWIASTPSTVFDTFAVFDKRQPVLFCWKHLALNDDTLALLHLVLSQITYFGRGESWCEVKANQTQSIDLPGVVLDGPDRTHWQCVCIEDHGKPIGMNEYSDYLLERRLSPVPLRIANGQLDGTPFVEEVIRLFSDLRKPLGLQAKATIAKHPDIAEHDWSAWSGRLEVIEGKKGKELQVIGDWSDAEIETVCKIVHEKKSVKLLNDLFKKCVKPARDFDEWLRRFKRTSASLLLLRCLLRESGQDIKDGLERPIGTRWVHYAVPRAIFDLPRPKPKARVRREEVVDLVRYALNTATVGRAVLPPLTDTLLVADKFRSATLAVYGEMFNKRKPNPNKSRNYDDSEFFPKALCGRERDGSLCQDHSHAFWWPVDEDNDGFIDHVMVHAPGRFDQDEADALRRLTRLKQRGGRPDLLVTPIYVGKADEYAPWKRVEDADSPGDGQLASVFVSATPFFSPVHLSHGRNRPGRLRSLQAVVRKSLRNQQLIDADNDVTIDELIFDYDPAQLANLQQPIESSDSVQSQPPRQLFQNREEADIIPPLPSRSLIHDVRYPNAMIKDPDAPYCLGTSTGLVVDDATRFIRTLSFCRRRRNHQLQGMGRMLCITFNRARSPKPFAIGDQCHFGMGLFVAEKESDEI